MYLYNCYNQKWITSDYSILFQNVYLHGLKLLNYYELYELIRVLRIMPYNVIPIVFNL